MSWGKILLILGCIAGTAAVLFGLLGLIGALTDPTLSPSDQNDTVVGALFIMGVGLTLLVPCAVLLIVLRPKASLPMWQPGSYQMSPPPPAPGAAQPMSSLSAQPGLPETYLQWFGWCQRETGGDAIALHAATMAALAKAVTGDSTGAQAAARDTVSARLPDVPTARPARIRGAMVKALARIGASTLPLLEPGERVEVSFYATDRSAQAWQYAFGMIGNLIAASQMGAYYVTVTDRRVIALTGAQLSRTPQSVAFIAARSMVTQARLRRVVLNYTFTLARVTGEQNRFRVGRPWGAEVSYAARLLAPGLIPTPVPILP